MGAKTPKRKSFAKDTKVSPFKKGNFTPGKGKGRNSNSPNPFKNTNGTPQSAKKFNKGPSPKKSPGGNTPKAVAPAIKKEPFSASKTPKVKEEFSSLYTIKSEPITENVNAGVVKETFSPKLFVKVKQEPTSAEKQYPTSVKKTKKEKRLSMKNDEVTPMKKAQLPKFPGTRSLFGSSQNESASKLTAKVKQESFSVTETPKVKQEPTSVKKAKKVKRHSLDTIETQEVLPMKKAKLEKVSATTSLFHSSGDKVTGQKTKENATTGTTTHEKITGKPTVKERKKERSEKWRGVCKNIRENRNEIRRALQTKDISGLSIKPEDIKKKIDVRKKVPLEKMSKSSKAALGTYCKLYELMTGIDEFPKVIRAPPTAEDLKKRIGELESNSSITKSGRKRLRLLKKRYKEMTGQITVVKSEKKETATIRNKKKLSTAVKSEATDEEKAIVTNKNKIRNEVDVVQQRDTQSSDEDSEESAESDVNEESDSENDTNAQIKSESQQESTDSELEESENNEEESDDSNESDYDVESNVKADKLTKKMNDDAGESSEDDGKSKKPTLSVLKKIIEPANNVPGEKGKKSKKANVKNDKQKKSGDNRQKEEPFLAQNQKRYVAFVGNLPYDITVEEIKAHFQKVGEVKHVRIPTEKGSNKPRGFAFVEVNDDKTYQKTLSMHQTFIKGRKINVSFTSGGKKMGGEKMKEIKAKNMKLQALRKQGKLTGSVKPSQKRAARRNKRKHLQTPQNND